LQIKAVNPYPFLMDAGPGPCFGQNAYT
jgi:hypothetical protein